MATTILKVLFISGLFLIPVAVQAETETPDKSESPYSQAIERATAETASGTATRTGDRCFIIGGDVPSNEEQAFHVPRQTVCPFVRLPEKREEKE